MLIKPDFEADEIVEFLQRHLADLHMVYSHLHNFHWNIEGAHFFEYHEHLQDMYEKTAELIDDVAERILQLGARPLANLVEYTDLSKLPALPSQAIGVPQVAEFVRSDLDYLISELRSGIVAAQRAEPADEATADFFIEMLRDHEKTRWFWAAIQG